MRETNHLLMSLQFVHMTIAHYVKPTVHNILIDRITVGVKPTYIVTMLGPILGADEWKGNRLCVMISSWPCGRGQRAVCGWGPWRRCVWSVSSGAPPSPAGPAGLHTPPGDGQTWCLHAKGERSLKHFLHVHDVFAASCVVLPFSSKAFLWASQSSSLVTIMPVKGSFPCKEKQMGETKEKLALNPYGLQGCKSVFF